MPRFAANLHYLFAEHPFLDRFQAAAEAGFRAVEFQVPYGFTPAELAARLRGNDLSMVLFDAPMGDWAAGERGLAAVPGREGEFRDGLAAVAAYAEALECSLVHVMAGVVAPGADLDEVERTYLANLRLAAQTLAPRGVGVVIEPINAKLGISADAPAYTTAGMRGYYLNHSWQARQILAKAACENLFLHLDLYHAQILEGNLAQTLRDCLPQLRHVQIAGVPGRHEPDRGEIHYPYLFALLDELGYEGWVGCEYKPFAGTRQGLGWGAAYGLHATPSRAV